MAKLLKMLWEYMDLTVLPFFETWSAHIFGGWQRVCWCTNEAFNQASPTKEFWENCPQKKGGHIYGKNEGWSYLQKLLYVELSCYKSSLEVFFHNGLLKFPRPLFVIGLASARSTTIDKVRYPIWYQDTLFATYLYTAIFLFYWILVWSCEKLVCIYCKTTSTSTKVFCNYSTNNL